ncbi:caspase family protein [Nonomuraea rubra]|uniref:HD domain-containing protein n=1 Tax=Nonomuraea rubra TaxID=46180 RepID=UPI00360FF4EE
MGQFRALLLGVAEYDDPGIEDLPFVTDDLVDVAVALETRGCAVDVVDGGGRVGRTRVFTEVSRFLAAARPDDTLLVYLSGHGAHNDNVDYLLPTDADLQWLRLADVAVPLTAWETVIESSPAAGVLFLVDACREGYHENVKSGVSRTAWSQRRVSGAARRNVAWLFPCSPGEVSRYVRAKPEIRPFSVFARALERAIADAGCPTTLSELKNAVARHMAALVAEHGQPQQQIRLRGEADHDGFVVLPGVHVAAGTSDGWTEAAAGHVAWQKTREVPGAERLRDDVISLVRALSAKRRAARAKLAADPWDDPRLALRMAERTSFLLGSLLNDLRLSPAEAALVVALPFIHDAYWAGTAAAASVVRPAGLAAVTMPTPEREAFEAYVRKHPRLLRRGLAAGQRTGAEIGWWLLHRWITGRAGAYDPQAIGALLAGQGSTGRLFGEVLEPGRLSEMMRLLYADAGFIARTDRPKGLSASVVIAPGLLGEQELRERMVGHLVIVAHRMAIETTRLSSVIVDHVGIAKPVVPVDVLRSIDEARWEPRGAGRVLRAACSHPAVEVALRDHVGNVDRLLTDIRTSEDPSLAPLAGLPGHADADQVRAAENDGGTAYTSAGIRFVLDEERVQELLMGEQLYGDEDLAIREIYQNALDACRYRKARTEYLRRTGAELPAWEGHIRFTQGIDDQGRPYIDCADNGIGMGVRELRDVFAQAGARFAELPEFLEEQAEWEALDPPVKLYPNSQFGIGVLSYFMLADEITVTTCRLGRDGTPGRRLRVSIAGPGTLFHIQDQGPGTDAGTVVRLHLRTAGDKSPVSCTDTLRLILWFSEFRVEAVDSVNVEVWLPNVLQERHFKGNRHPVPGMPVWWCDGQGAELADGLKTQSMSFGVIVNLTGENMPELSVDRKFLLNSPRNMKIVTQVLSDAVHVFSEPDGPLASFDWLCEFVENQPVVADLIFETVMAEERPLSLNGRSLDFRKAGLLSPDRHLVRPVDSYRRGDYFTQRLANRRERRGAEPLTDHLMEWRLASLSSDRPAAGERARPSDAILLDTHPMSLNTVRGRRHSWLPVDDPVPAHHIVSVAIRTGYTIGDMARRLQALGFQVPSALLEVGDPEPTDLMLLSTNLNGVRLWIRAHDEAGRLLPVAIGHVVAAAAQFGQPIRVVADRLTALGFAVPAPLSRLGAAEPADRIIVSQDLDGTLPGYGHTTASAVPNRWPRDTCWPPLPN